MTKDTKSRLERPVFVVGAQRSGTTLLRLMLDHHPEISCPHEMDYLAGLVSPAGDLPGVEPYRAFLQEHGSFRRSGLEIDPDLDFRALLDDLVLQHTAAQTVRCAVVHANIDRLLLLWPDARFIHMIRDPRDVARSCMRMGWTGNTWFGAERWLQVEREWDTLESRLAPDRHCEVRYEDLVTAPEASLRRLCEFLGVDWSGAMLTYDRDSTYALPTARLAEQWRAAPMARDVRLAEARLGDFLEKRGYAPSESPGQVGAIERMLLPADDKLRAWRFRARQFGALLALSEALSRRLGLTRWHARVSARLEAISTQNLR